MTTKESEVDVLNAMKHAVSVLHGVADDGADTRRYADNLHAARAAVAEAFEAARNASAVLSHAYHTQIRGELEQDAHDAYQRLDTALRNAGVKL